MGTVTRTIMGHGYTQAEAEKDAFAGDRDYLGHQEGYGGGYDSLREILSVKQITAPKPPKGVRIEKRDNAKPVWKKRWVVTVGWREQRNRDVQVYETFEKKADAMKFAKWKAVDAKIELEVTHKYVTISGHAPSIEVIPKAGTPGKWAFECDFRE